MPREEGNFVVHKGDGKLQVLADDGPATLGRMGQEGNKRSLETIVECRTSTGWRKARALIDSGAELNLVSQLFVKEAGWQLRLDGALPVEAADGCRVLVYDTLKVTTNIQDRDAKSRKHQDKYVSADISNYDMILGEPWLQTRNPDIDWEAKT